jgi:hypothetical protein
MSTLGASAQMAHTGERTATRSLSVVVLPAAALIVLLAVALLLLFTPPWVHFAISATGGDAWAPSPAVAHELSDQTIAELLVGPATFSFAGPNGAPFYTPDEAAHLRDVRVVLLPLLGLAVASAGVLAWALVRHGREPATWRGLARGGVLVAAGLAVAGLVAGLAWTFAFELFHRLLFPGGNWSFPATSNLVRLYPVGFWQLSAAAIGLLGIAGGVLTWLVGRRRARQLGRAS